MTIASPRCVSQSIIAVASVLTAVMLRLAALERADAGDDEVLFPDRSPADYFFLAETET